MNARHPGCFQLFGLVNSPFDPDLRGVCIGFALQQLVAQFFREIHVEEFRQERNVAQRLDRLDPRNDRNIDPDRPAGCNEVKYFLLSKNICVTMY
jgi:hypothetical protein